jgi:hypothetical protein
MEYHVTVDADWRRFSNLGPWVPPALPVGTISAQHRSPLIPRPSSSMFSSFPSHPFSPELSSSSETGRGYRHPRMPDQANTAGGGGEGEKDGPWDEDSGGESFAWPFTCSLVIRLFLRASSMFWPWPQWAVARRLTPHSLLPSGKQSTYTRKNNCT